MGLMERSPMQQVSLGSLIITNPCLDTKKVGSIADDIRGGIIKLCDLFPLYVCCGEDGMYYINDGNSRVQAMRDVGISAEEVVYVEFYIKPDD